MALIAVLVPAIVSAAPKKRPAARPAPRPAPRLSNAQLLAGALTLNTIKPGDDVFAACRQSDFKTLALVFAKVKYNYVVEKGEFETEAEFGARRVQAEAAMNSVGDLIVCQPLNDNEDAPFEYDADSERFIGRFKLHQNVWRDSKALGSYVSSTAMGAKARVQASAEFEYDVEYSDFSTWERSQCLTGFYDKQYTVPVPRAQAPLVKAGGYQFVIGKLVWPFARQTQRSGIPTLTDPFDVYNRTVALSVRPERIGITGPDGQTYFDCQLQTAAPASAANLATHRRLQAALAQLGQNPRDMEALIEAGGASLAINDLDAAVGFFRRADQIAPGNPNVIAGLAAALARDGNPRDALAGFERAERLGPIAPIFLADKGLALDLIGDNASAQQAYRTAIAASGNNGDTTRLAISLAIAGNNDEAEKLLSAGVSRDDPATMRAHAFALAIRGRGEEAIAVARAVLPSNVATEISPYLRYLPRLTRIQQAAAANLGAFPRASQIGRDTPSASPYGAEASTTRSGATVDIAAPLRAAARAATQSLITESDEDFRTLHAAWVALDR